MKHTFKFSVKDCVEVNDYSSPSKKYNGVVIKRWLEEPYAIPANPVKKVVLSEHYDVLVFKEGGKPQNCTFLAQDLTIKKKVETK